LIAGNLIGTDKSGTHELPNAQQGVLIEGSPGNTVGGTSKNLISSNHWGIQLDGATATGNVVLGNFVGTDISGQLPLGNEVDGVVFTNSASGNTVGGSSSGQGNTIAFNSASGVDVLSGNGDTIRSNAIFANGQQGIVLGAGGNDAQPTPMLTGASGGGTTSNLEGTIAGFAASTNFVIEFFSSDVTDPAGHYEGRTLLGSTTVTTGSTGAATINFNLPVDIPTGDFVTATATNLTTGDTSPFSNSMSSNTVSAQPVTVQFALAAISVNSTAGLVMVDVQRSGNLSVAVSVNYATSNGSAIAGQDYTAVAGSVTFPPNVTDETFTIPILANPNRSTSSSSVNLTLSQPIGGATLGMPAAAFVTIVNNSSAASQFIVTNTSDSGPGSLRQAIVDANAATGSSTVEIQFDMPASTAANLDLPVPGFDPSTQDWTIALQSPLPPITRPIVIDGLSQAHLAIPFRYPLDLSSQSDDLSVTISTTGGTYKLSVATYTDRSGIVHFGTTGNIPFNATGSLVQSQLENIVGAGNVIVTQISQASGPGSYAITFQGESTGLAIKLQAIDQVFSGSNAAADITVVTPGGNPIAAPAEIASTANATPAESGNNAQPRVIIDGSQTGGGTGFVLDSSGAMLRGLIIDGFGVGVSVPTAGDVGNLIQGNDIGRYLLYPVDPNSGLALPSPDAERLAGRGNAEQGVVVYGTHTTVGGASPQDENVIAGNGAQGVLLEPGSAGCQVLGNQIGVIGPSLEGVYWQAGNGV
jgi:hypothetical protein